MSREIKSLTQVRRVKERRVEQREREFADRKRMERSAAEQVAHAERAEAQAGEARDGCFARFQALQEGPRFSAAAAQALLFQFEELQVDCRKAGEATQHARNEHQTTVQAVATAQSVLQTAQAQAKNIEERLAKLRLEQDQASQDTQDEDIEDSKSAAAMLARLDEENRDFAAPRRSTPARTAPASLN